MIKNNNAKKRIKKIIQAEKRLIPLVKYNKKTLLKVLIVYPDYYENGIPNLGHQVLYKEILKQKNVFVDRLYLLQEHYQGKSLFSWENHLSLNAFDLILFSISFESLYSNILKILNLSNIPLSSENRKDNFPIIIGGGHCATYNPEPLAYFFDAFIIGDGEEIIHDVILNLKHSKIRSYDKEKVLKRLAMLDGIYIPSFYTPEYNEKGSFKKWTKKYKLISEKINRIYVKDINNHPVSSIFVTPNSIYRVPSFSIEVTRGCKMNCRFCMMAHTLRPQRQLTLENIMNKIKIGLNFTPLIKLFFESLYKDEMEDLFYAMEPLIEQGLQIRLGSLRAEYLTDVPIKFLSKMGQNTIILAPETVSGNMRNSINKGTIKDYHVFNIIKKASDHGIENFGLYLLMGLPDEEDQDIEKIALFIENVRHTMNSYNMKGVLEIHMNPIFPKPFTPFQWMRMLDSKIAKNNIKKITSILQSKDINVIYNPIKNVVVGIENKEGHKLNNAIIIRSIINSKSMLIQPILSRGDRRVGNILYEAYKNGDTMKAWKDALKNSKISTEICTNEKPLNYIFPWEFINHGIDRKYLENEWKLARMGKTSPTCFNGCSRCNLCNNTIKISEEKCQKKLMTS